MPTGKTLRDLGVKDGSLIKVDIYKIPITINTLDGDQIELEVDPTEPMSGLKKQLEDKSGLPASNQRLFFQGQDLDDKKCPADYNMKPGSELDLEPKSIKITLDMPDGSTKEVEIAPSDTLDNIKAKIAEETGMDAARQAL